MRDPGAQGLGAYRPQVRLLDSQKYVQFHSVGSAHASVAQLDSASVFGTEGCRFESCRAYCKFTKRIVGKTIT